MEGVVVQCWIYIKLCIDDSVVCSMLFLPSFIVISLRDSVESTGALFKQMLKLVSELGTGRGQSPIESNPIA